MTIKQTNRDIGKIVMAKVLYLPFNKPGVMRILLMTLVAIFLASCQPKNLPTVVIISGEQITAKFSHMTTKAEIEAVAKKIAFTGGELDYSQSIFFDDGKLRTLILTIKSPLGKVGSTKADLTGLQYGYVGFMIGAEGQMKVGKME
jgi:hypothetical protein